MNILICFIGLQRSISQTHNNLKKSIYDNNNKFITIFVTWESENTDEFIRCFPEAIIYKIPNIYINNNAEFDKWSSNINMHCSWIGTYLSNRDALFNYYRQIYLWYKSALILETYKEIDIIIRCRTDIEVNGDTIKEYYARLNINDILFPKEPKYGFLENCDCPDTLFMGKPTTVISVLKILDHIEYIYNTYNHPIQPETTMYFMVKYKKYNLQYMNNSINICRYDNRSKLEIWNSEKNI